MKCLSIYSLTLFISLLCSFTLHKSAPAPTRWVVMNGGSLKVKGTTNINTFKCDITGYSNSDTILVYKNQIQEGNLPLKGRLGLSVKLFDCHHAVMTADLRKTLKAKEFPQLKISFINLEKFPALSSRESKIKGTVDIELAGKVKRFTVDYTFKLDNQRNIQLLGERDVNFSDFGLTPPRKLGGMIQTDNKLSVEFKLTLKTLS
ncbi:YceI family protein [Arcticibacter sp.]|uniref:YceI family protein n=1 Tax=Arcticibacter sp. TaxID=1872630 RepID=UPI0038909A6A